MVPMEMYKFDSIKINDLEGETEYLNSHLFFDDDQDLIVLPSLFSLSLKRNLEIKHTIETVDKDTGEVHLTVESKAITEPTYASYMTEMKRFLFYINEVTKHSKDFPADVHKLENIKTKFFKNHYLKDLIEVQKMGDKTLSHTIPMIKAFYHSLTPLGFPLPLGINKLSIPKNSRQNMVKNTRRKTAPKYVTHKIRSLMIEDCRTIRDEVILRCGWELGLRTKENTGIFYNDFFYGKDTHKGIKSLIEDMEKDEKIFTFDYYLPGTFVKQSRHVSGVSTGEGRILKIPRNLLMRMKDYIHEERAALNDEQRCLFVNARGDKKTIKGTSISESRATTVFEVARNRLIKKQNEPDYQGAMIDEANTYHHGRHTFGTELFHLLLNGRDTSSITPDSDVMHTVAERMGHAMGKYGEQITSRYIRSCKTMRNAEGL